jgi:hypothetical protein
MRTVLALTIMAAGCHSSGIAGGSFDMATTENHDPDQDMVVINRPHQDMSTFDLSTGGHQNSQDMAQQTGGQPDMTQSVDVDMAESPAGPDMTPPPPSCADHASYCTGDVLTLCDTIGHTVYKTQQCGDGDSHNPEICGTGSCYGMESCCRKTNPAITWSVTSPRNDSGDIYVRQQVPNCANGPGIPYPYLSASWFAGVGKPMCGDLTVPDGGYAIGLTVDTSLVTPGTYTMPNSGFMINWFDNGGNSCGQWTGTVHYVSALPDWRVFFDLTCTQGDKTTHFVGDLRGSQ